MPRRSARLPKGRGVYRFEWHDRAAPVTVEGLGGPHAVHFRRPRIRARRLGIDDVLDCIVGNGVAEIGTQMRPLFYRRVLVGVPTDAARKREQQTYPKSSRESAGPRINFAAPGANLLRICP